VDLFASLAYGFSVTLAPANLFACFVGVFVGTLIGVLPGIGPVATMSLLLPVTYALSPTASIIMMAGVYYGAMYGGSTTSILVNIPGEAASVVTCLDGYQMARQGRAGPALGISAIGSFIAGTLSVLGIMLLAPPLTKAALRFGPPEIFALLLLGFTMVTYLTAGSKLKAVAMALLGMLLGTIGLLPTREDWRRSAAPIARGSVLGFFLGILPGIGAIIPTFISYALERRLSKHPERFGTGMIEGVAAPEAANNATAMAGFIPLLSLGIPTTPALAILLGTLMINGLTPGPMLFQQQGLLVWTVIGSMLIANTALLILNLPLVGLWARISRIPYHVLGPIVLAVCLVGAYAPRNTMFDVWVAFGFGIVGYVMRRLDLPLAPLVLGFLLGPLFEQSLRQSIAMQGTPMIFLTRPIPLALVIAAVVVLLTTIWLRYRSRVVMGLIRDSTNET
jgi:putative tricarboxylic transport membrane protein